MASVLTSARKSADARRKNKVGKRILEKDPMQEKKRQEKLKKAAEAAKKAETEKKAGESRKSWLSYENLGKAVGAKADIKKGDTEVTKRAKEKDAFTGGAIESGKELLNTLYKQERAKKSAKKVLAFKAEQAAARRREMRGKESRKAARDRKARRFSRRTALLQNL